MSEFLIIVVVVIALGLYIKYSPDAFASAVRPWIPFLQRKAADQIESVDALTESARQKQAAHVTKGRRSLFDVKTALFEAKAEIEAADQEIADDHQAMALAKKKGDREAFYDVVKELNKDLAFRASLTAPYQALVAELNDLEVSVEEQQAKEEAMEAEARVLQAQNRVADVTIQVNMAAAQLDGDTGADSQMAQAKKILAKKMAKAGASKEAAKGLTDRERREKKVDALMTEAKNNATKVNADELWNSIETTAAK